MKFKYFLPLVFVISIVIYACSTPGHLGKNSHEHVTQLPDSLVNWEDSLHVRALDSIQDSVIFCEVRAFRDLLTSKLKKSGNVAMALALIEELEKQKYFAHSSIDTFKGTLYDRVPFITLKPNPEIYPWFCESNNAGVSIPRNGDTEYKIVSEITTRLGDQTNVDGEVIIFTELPPCNSCSHAIYLFNKRYPELEVEVLYSPYGRLIPLK